MCQTLYWIPLEIGGVPVFGFGLLLAAWVLVSLAIMVCLVRKQGFSADTWGYVPILAIVAAVIVWLLPMLCKPQGLPVRGYGVMMLVAVLAAVGLAAWRARRLGLDPEMIFSLGFWLFVPGIIGARAFYVAEYWSQQYWPIYGRPDGGPLALVGAVLNVAEGGLVVYGSLIGAAAGLLAFVWKHRVPLLALCDLIAPSLMLGLAIGRLGCLLNGCCFGEPCDLAWAVTFPPESPPYQSQVARGQMLGFSITGDPEAPPVVRSVDAGSGAAAAGLASGDQLAAVDGYPVPTIADAQATFERVFGAGKPIRLELSDGRSVVLPTPHVPARSLPIHPTQVYSSISALLICLLLLAYDPFRRRDGELIALMLTIYPANRFLLEVIRNDEGSFLGTRLTVSQNVSLAVLAAVLGLWVYVLHRPPGKAFERAAGAAGDG
jgi:phosphatidylglycerol:prolipoprotein diacylglycerol transferase